MPLTGAMAFTNGSAATVATMMFINIPQGPDRIVVPRHRTLSPGVARVIAKVAGWLEP